MKSKLLIILCLVSGSLFASDSLLCKLTLSTSYFTVDALSDIYYINSGNEIVKTNCSATTKFTYSNKNLGRPSYIDVSNLMKVVVFYPDQQTIVILNNQLSELSMLTLKGNINATNYQPSAICKHAGTDHIWMYDELSRTLIRLDESGNPQSVSEAFDQLFPESIEVTGLFSAQDKVYVATEQNQLLVFDAYASFIQELPVNMQVNQITDKYIVGIHEQFLQFFDLRNQATLAYSIKGLDARLLGNSLFMHGDTGIAVYHMDEQ